MHGLGFSCFYHDSFNNCIVIFELFHLFFIFFNFLGLIYAKASTATDLERNCVAAGQVALSVEAAALVVESTNNKGIWTAALLACAACCAAAEPHLVTGYFPRDTCIAG